jgi:iron complex outermembrane receptor protein
MITQRYFKVRKLLLLLIFLILFSSDPDSVAKQQDANEPADFFDMSIEELMEVEVVSASRQAQKMDELSVPVTVITSEDIHYSGLTSIPEILQFATSMDVLRLDRNRYAVGVRGLHDFTSDRTLILVNGRIADSPLFGGSEFYRLPVLLEDIERIEVVRGPGGAAWGANAFTGVINIITKQPEDVLGTFVSTKINEFGDTYTHLRYAERDGKWSWRTSVGYEEIENSDEAGAGRYASSGNAIVNGLISFSGFSARDFAYNTRFDSEAIYMYSDQTKISFGAAYSHIEKGDFEFGGYFPRQNTWLETVWPYAKIDHKFEDGSSGYLQWFGHFANSKASSLLKWSSSENDIEGQLNFEPKGNHKLSVGGNVRFIRLNSEVINVEDVVLNGEPFDEQLAGLFLIDRWNFSDSLTLEGQIRGDWYSETQKDWSTRLTAFHPIDEQENHILRFSLAKAFRTPLAALRESSVSRISMAPLVLPGYMFNVLKPTDDLKNEETWSFESGYKGRITKEMTLHIDGYYQRFSEMIGYRTVADPLSLGRLYYQADNIDGADSYGVELEIEKKTKTEKISVWYACNYFRADQSDQNLRSYNPARHKVGITGRLFLSDGWTLNANYRYTDTTTVYSSRMEPVGSSHRLDLGIAKGFANGKGEIMLGVSDVLNETNGPNYGMGQLTAHETPGRMFFTRLQWRF